MRPDAESLIVGVQCLESKSLGGFFHGYFQVLAARLSFPSLRLNLLLCTFLRAGFPRLYLFTPSLPRPFPCHSPALCGVPWQCGPVAQRLLQRHRELWHSPTGAAVCCQWFKQDDPMAEVGAAAVSCGASTETGRWQGQGPSRRASPCQGIPAEPAAACSWVSSAPQHRFCKIFIAK